MNNFAVKLNIAKNYGSAKGCWHDTAQRYLNGNQAIANFDISPKGVGGKVILADGQKFL